MNNKFTLGIQGAIEPNITFLTNSSKEAMRIDKNGVWVNPDFPMDEAAQYVINALDEHIKGLIYAEREACAKVAEDSDHVVEGRGYYDQLGDADATVRNIVAAIRARSNT